MGRSTARCSTSISAAGRFSTSFRLCKNSECGSFSRQAMTTRRFFRPHTAPCRESPSPLAKKNCCLFAKRPSPLRLARALPARARAASKWAVEVAPQYPRAPAVVERRAAQAFLAARQSFQIRRRASFKEMRPAQTACARHASTPSFLSASGQGSSRRLRGSSGAPPSASGMTWSSSKRLLSASVRPRSRSLLSLIAFVTSNGGRTVFVQPRTQIVSAMFCCVTSGLSGRFAACAFGAKAKSATMNNARFTFAPAFAS